MIDSYPWYITDWRESPAVLGMTAEQRDIYRNLLDICWRDGSLPTEENVLRKMSLAEPAEWRRSWKIVKLQFIERDGKLFNRKVDEKRPAVLKSKADRALGAALTNEIKRAKRDAQRDAQRDGERYAERNAQCTPPPSPSPTLHPTPPLYPPPSASAPGGVSVSEDPNEPEKPHKPTLAEQRVAWFEQKFWRDPVPRIGKGAALKAWCKVAKDTEAAERIAAAARKQYPLLIEHAKRKGYTVIHPATWLNQGRFDDDANAIQIDLLDSRNDVDYKELTQDPYANWNGDSR